jgi:hypothetical protein
VTTTKKNDDESISLDEWEMLEAATRKQILGRLDAWRADDARREAFLLARIRAGCQLNQAEKSC